MSFQNWTIDKKVKESDLIFLQSLKSSTDLELFNQISEAICRLTPSFSEGLQIFELITDLILMGHNEELFINLESLEQYKAHLRKLRYPVASERDESLKNRFETLPWPYGSKIKFERRGDRAGVELKLFISSAVDLTKMISSLERVQQELVKNEAN